MVQFFSIKIDFSFIARKHQETVQSHNALGGESKKFVDLARVTRVATIFEAEKKYFVELKRKTEKNHPIWRNRDLNYLVRGKIHEFVNFLAHVILVFYP